MATRFGTASDQDTTGRTLTYALLSPAYAATIALVVNAFKTFCQYALLTGALTTTANTTGNYIGDTLVCLFLADGTNRTVTFSTGFAPSATLVVTASKRASCSFVWDGTAWVETGRAIQA